jgi:quinol monooxygenase YgiN
MATTTPPLALAFVAKLVAKDDTAGELADLLTSALELANAEAGTVVWFALQTEATTFWIVDAFATDEARQAHLEGPIAAALMANADRLLAAPPEILRRRSSRPRSPDAPARRRRGPRSEDARCSSASTTSPACRCTAT